MYFCHILVRHNYLKVPAKQEKAITVIVRPRFSLKINHDLDFLNINYVYDGFKNNPYGNTGIQPGCVTRPRMINENKY